VVEFRLHLGDAFELNLELMTTVVYPLAQGVEFLSGDPACCRLSWSRAGESITWRRFPPRQRALTEPTRVGTPANGLQLFVGGMDERGAAVSSAGLLSCLRGTDTQKVRCSARRTPPFASDMTRRAVLPPPSTVRQFDSNIQAQRLLNTDGRAFIFLF
jgi:hypothetical protein